MDSSRDYIYDIETYPNIFTCAFIHVDTKLVKQFEISERRNDLAEFKHFITSLANFNARMVGYNNLYFDYPIIHAIFQHPVITPQAIHNWANQIINGENILYVWPSDHKVEQIDLLKIWHFDNKGVSLKQLEFAMQMVNIEDLPFDVNTNLTHEQMDVLHQYNLHDCKATLKFYNLSRERIAFREELTQKYDRNFINCSDTKIGVDYFTMMLQQQRVECYEYRNGNRQPKQTLHPNGVKVNDIILPYIKFDKWEFNEVRNYMSTMTINNSRGDLKIKQLAYGLKFSFGSGGLHASVNNRVYRSNDEYQIVDVDVTSYYPNLIIANRFFPEHLSEKFCDVCNLLFHDRKKHAKGTSINKTLKLALNSIFGKLNDKYSQFFDTKLLLSITINGQLLLCMLIDKIMQLISVELIQANTDGVTVYCPKACVPVLKSICGWWEDITKLTLESVNYNRMFVRDVNNYIAEDEHGNIKRNGAYDVDSGDYNRDFSAQVVQRAANAHLLQGVDIEQFINNHINLWDFCLLMKSGKHDRVCLDYDNGLKQELSRYTRYYVAKTGPEMKIYRPPTGELGAYKRKPKVPDALWDQVTREIPQGQWDERIHTKNKSTYQVREQSVCKGFNVIPCNNINHFSWQNLNRDYYIEQAYKLVNVFN